MWTELSKKERIERYVRQNGAYLYAVHSGAASCPTEQRAARQRYLRAQKAFKAASDVVGIACPTCTDHEGQRLIRVLADGLRDEDWDRACADWIKAQGGDPAQFFEAMNRSLQSLEPSQPAPVALPELPDGPGKLLSVMIKRATGFDTAECPTCYERALKMNEWGWWKCFVAHRSEIVGWMVEACKTRGIEPDAAMLLRAFKGAFRHLPRPGR